MERWTTRTPEDWPELEKSPRPIIAQWVAGDSDLTLYEDGMIEVLGFAPVELLPHVQAAWFNFMRGKVA